MRYQAAPKGIIFSTFNYTIMAVLAFTTLYPFWNLLVLSLNDPTDSIRGGLYFLPREWSWTSYESIFTNPDLLGAFLRSVARVVLGTGASLIATIMLAYTLSRREFIWRKGFNAILVISMYVNGGLIPTYILIKQLHLINSFWVYLLPGLIGAFNVIIIRSNFEQLPAGLLESAKIDGASEFQSLFRILVPISLPVLSTITLFLAVYHWNSWFDNYLYNRNQNLSLMQYELMKIVLGANSQIQQASQGGRVDESLARSVTPESLRAAMTIVVTSPILMVYPFIQRYFIQGMTVGALKE